MTRAHVLDGVEAALEVAAVLQDVEASVGWDR